MDIKCLVIKYIFLFVWILIGNKEYIICIFFLLKNLYMFSRNFVLNYILIFIFNCKLFFFYKMFVVCDDLVNLFILLIIDIVN